MHRKTPTRKVHKMYELGMIALDFFITAGSIFLAVVIIGAVLLGAFFAIADQIEQSRPVGRHRAENVDISALHTITTTR